MSAKTRATPKDNDKRLSIARDAVVEMSFLLDSLTEPAARLRLTEDRTESTLITAVVLRGRQLLSVALEMLDDDMAEPTEAKHNIVRYGTDEECYLPEGAKP